MEGALRRLDLAAGSGHFPVVSLGTEFGHAVFGNDMGGWDAKPLGDLLVEFGFRERARTALVAAGFHQARPFGEWKAAPEFRQTSTRLVRRSLRTLRARPMPRWKSSNLCAPLNAWRRMTQTQRSPRTADDLAIAQFSSSSSLCFISATQELG